MKYVALFLYFGVLFLLGLIASRRIKDLKDFYVGGKKLGYWVVAFSARATGESGWLLLGLTGMGAMMGYSTYWVVFGEVLGVALAWFFMAKPFKRITDEYDSITIPDYLHSRFSEAGRLIRMVAAAILAIFIVIYVSSQIDATGTAFEQFLGWNYYTGALVGFLIVVAYIFTGGFVAVAWSDLFQGILMFLGLVALPLVMFLNIDNTGAIHDTLHSMDPGLTNWMGPYDDFWLNMATLGGFMFIGLGFLGSPQVFVRFISVKDLNEINKGRWVAIAFTLLTDAAAVSIGVLGRFLFTTVGEDPELVLGKNAESVLATGVYEYMPEIIIGFYIAVVLSAIMSTVDSLLVVGSSAVTRDYYQKLKHPEMSNEKLTSLSRNITLAMALLALGIALTIAALVPERSVFWFIIFGWSGIAATFCPVIILSLFWKRYNAWGALASMISGFIAVAFFKFYLSNQPGIGPYLEKLDVLGPSFAVAMIFGVIFTLLKPVRS